jgi:hypothetical protein
MKSHVGAVGGYDGREYGLSVASMLNEALHSSASHLLKSRVADAFCDSDSQSVSVTGRRLSELRAGVGGMFLDHRPKL